MSLTPEILQNKTASAVQLKHLPTGLVVKSQATRSREQNRKIARSILSLKLEERFKGDESRAAKLREKASKKKASKTKKAKRKYAKLEAEKSVAVEEQIQDEDEDDRPAIGLEFNPRSTNEMSETAKTVEETITPLKSRHPKPPISDC